MKITKRPFSKNFVPKGGFVKFDFIRSKDGDTMVGKINGVRENVRLLVIDTPELAKEEPFAEEAKDYLNNVLENAKEVYLQSDRKSSLRDNTEQKRLLAWVWADGELVNYNLVRLGYARVRYIENEQLHYLKRLRKAEKLAKRKKRRIHKGE